MDLEVNRIKEVRKVTHALVLDCRLFSDLEFSSDEVTKAMLIILLLEWHIQQGCIVIIS
jgi:hypothetical protein